MNDLYSGILFWSMQFLTWFWWSGQHGMEESGDVNFDQLAPATRGRAAPTPSRTWATPRRHHRLQLGLRRRHATVPRGPHSTAPRGPHATVSRLDRFFLKNDRFFLTRTAFLFLLVLTSFGPYVIRSLILTIIVLLFLFPFVFWSFRPLTLTPFYSTIEQSRSYPYPYHTAFFYFFLLLVLNPCQSELSRSLSLP